MTANGDDAVASSSSSSSLAREVAPETDVELRVSPRIECSIMAPAAAALSAPPSVSPSLSAEAENADASSSSVLAPLADEDATTAMDPSASLGDGEAIALCWPESSAASFEAFDSGLATALSATVAALQPGGDVAIGDLEASSTPIEPPFLFGDDKSGIASAADGSRILPTICQNECCSSNGEVQQTIDTTSSTTSVAPLADATDKGASDFLTASPLISLNCTASEELPREEKAENYGAGAAGDEGTSKQTGASLRQGDISDQEMADTAPLLSTSVQSEAKMLSDEQKAEPVPCGSNRSLDRASLVHSIPTETAVLDASAVVLCCEEIEPLLPQPVVPLLPAEESVAVTPAKAEDAVAVGGLAADQAVKPSAGALPESLSGADHDEEAPAQPLPLATEAKRTARKRRRAPLAGQPRHATGAVAIATAPQLALPSQSTAVAATVLDKKAARHRKDTRETEEEAVGARGAPSLPNIAAPAVKSTKEEPEEAVRKLAKKEVVAPAVSAVDGEGPSGDVATRRKEVRFLKRSSVAIGTAAEGAGTNQTETESPHPSSPAVLPPSSLPPAPPLTLPSRPVLNIAGVNIQALLAENSDPPPLYQRRQRRTRRRPQLTDDHHLFAEHRDLRRHGAATASKLSPGSPAAAAAAPIASDGDVLQSLNEWADSVPLVYARLIWRYIPDAALQLVLSSSAANFIDVKHERKPEEEASVKREERDDDENENAE